LIIGTITVYRQLNFIQHKSLGFNKENLMVVSVPAYGYMEAVATFKDNLFSDPKVVSSSMASGIPGQRMPFLTVALPDATTSRAEDAASLSEGFGMRVLSGDADLLKTLGVDITEGRDFERYRQNDEEEAFILNEAAVEWLELKDPVGTRFNYLYGLDTPKEGKIIGVAENFHYASLHNDVEPIMIHIFPYYSRYLIIRLQTEHISKSVNHIEQKWSETLPDAPFSYFFLDTFYDNLYRSEGNMSTIITYFAILAIIIACLGLFGLASFITEQRTKEIGIRKILGASMSSIVKALSVEFMTLVLIANIIAWVPAYLLMQDWLEDFAYRTRVGFWVFVIATLISFIIAFATISFQSLKAARANPVNAIKYE
jgi:putative ABC transport system permease protein